MNLLVSDGRTSRDALVSLVVALLGTALRLPTSMLSARLLGPSGKGTLTLLLLIAVHVPFFVSLSIEGGLVHFLGAKAMTVPQAWRASGPLGLILGGIGLLILWPIAVWILPPETSLTVVILMALTIPLTVVGFYARGILRGSGRIITDSMLHFSSVVIAAATMIVLFAISAPDEYVYRASIAAGMVPSLIAILLIMARGSASRNSSKQDRVRLIRFGAKSHLGGVLQSLNFRLDSYLLAVLLGVYAVGVYSVAVAVAELLLVLPIAMQGLVMHRASQSDSALTAQFSRLISTSALLGGAFLALAAPFLVPLLYGRAFEPAIPVLILLVPGIWSLTMWTTLTNDLIGRGYPGVKSVSASVGLATTLIVGFVAIPAAGILGAAVTSSLAYTISFLVAWRKGAGILQRPLRQMVFATRQDLRLVAHSLRSLVPRPLVRRAGS
jgi:O-antigen/teichoic acid export membrane protein